MPPPDALRHLLESQYREALAPVTERLFAAANIAAGQRVLDVGTGGGDTALLAAERTGPQGFVLATDTSLDAVQGLLQRLRDLPRPLPIEVEPVAAEFLALEPESFDVAIARNSVMSFGELLRALGNVRAALRPGGRFVAAVYGAGARAVPLDPGRSQLRAAARFASHIRNTCRHSAWMPARSNEH